jgi:GT2 family glycosyltransferase
MTTPSNPVVAVCIPVWNGSDFVAETIASVLAQQAVAMRVHISIDGPDDASRLACEPFLRDSRVSLLMQPVRLGWVRHCAAVLGLAAAPDVDYACIQPHDDIMEAGYLSTLVAVAEAEPSAAVVYSDMVAFGIGDFDLRQPSAIGSPLSRMTALLLDHFNAVAFRGLTRMSALRAVEPMAGNPMNDFAVDTVWMTRLATQGDLIRVPSTLYRKRYHAGNTHGAWNHWPREQRIAAWTRHCIDMLREAAKVAGDSAALAMLIEAARMRLLGTGGTPLHFQTRPLTASEYAQMSHEFDMVAAQLRPNSKL